MKVRLNHIGLVSVMLISTCSFAQVGELESVEIEIVKERQITLPKANRHFEKVPPRPFEPIEPAITYDLRAINFATPPVNPSIRPLRLQKEPPTRFSKGYLTAGYGNYASPFFDVFVNTEKDKDRILGARAFLSSSGKGPVDGKNSASGNYGIGFYARGFTNDMTGGVSLDYENRFTHFYGYPTGTEVARDTIRQAYNLFSLGGDLASSRNNNIHFNLKGKFNYLADRFSATESEIVIDFDGEYRVDDDTRIHLSGGYSLAVRNDVSVDKKGRSLFDFNPAVTFSPDDVLQVRVGGMVALENDTLDSKAFHLYPDFEVRYPISDKVVLIGALTGGMEKVTLRSLASENLWIGPNVHLNHTNKLADLSGRLDFNLGGKFQATAGFSVARLKNLYFYMNDPTDASRFDAVYDAGTTTRSDLFASVEFLHNNVFGFMLRGDLYGYDTDELAEAWHRPGYRVTGNLHYDIYNKIFLKAGLTALGNMHAFDPEAMQSVKLDPTFDLHTRVEYRFSDMISAFVELNNLTAASYPLYLNYPARGFQVLGGICWTF